MKTLRQVTLALLTLIALAAVAPSALAQDDAPAEPRPRYMEAIERELTATSRNFTCSVRTASTAECSIRRRLNDGAEEVAKLVYSDETDTVYAYIPRIASVAAGDATLGLVLRRLMELNHSMLGTKFEWNSDSGEVRLSMVMHTDSNFDRRAFRSMLRTVSSVADRYRGELTRLAAASD